VITVLSGGVGGAKLALGLYHALPRGDLTAIVNTGDDFVHLGLPISPDVDTMLYTLADLNNEELGWGRRDETWTFMDVTASLGGADWFRLGDGDLALHVERARRLGRGETLSEVVAAVADAWGIHARILPMTDDRVATVVATKEHGVLPFQEYFVQHRCAPTVTQIAFEDGTTAAPAPGVVDALAGANVVVIAPSNPYLSVDPILAVPGLRTALERTNAPVVAVSPIVGGAAIKGPAAKIMGELGIEVSPAAVARHYDGLIDGFILDRLDNKLRDMITVPCLVTDTIMTSLADKERLARELLDFAADLPRKEREP